MTGAITVSTAPVGRKRLASVMLAFVSVLLSGCALFARPVGASAEQLTESQRLYATWGRSIEASRSTLAAVTAAVGAAYGRELVTTDQVRQYRDAAVLADRSLSVAAGALAVAIEAAQRREQLARGEPATGPPPESGDSCRERVSPRIDGEKPAQCVPGADAIAVAISAAGDALAEAVAIATRIGAWR